MEKGEYGGKRGFTIIEVALVLAIAGLIFMMVFIALPALQRSQRDSRRRDDIMVLIQTIKKYQSNNRGALPTGTGVVTYVEGSDDKTTSWQGFYDKYLGKDFNDPDGDHYALDVVECGAGSSDAECDSVATSVRDSGFPFTVGNTKYVIVIVKQAVCSGEKAIRSSNPRNVAALYRLEGAGSYCNNT